MKTFKAISLAIFISSIFNLHAHVPFLKPNQFTIEHNRLQIESSFTEFPFQADYAMSSPCFSIINPDGTQSILTPTTKTGAAQYLTPTIQGNGTYRINAAEQKGPKYTAIETIEEKLYFADEIKTKQGKMTSLQYYSGADTYLAKGEPNYKPQLLKKGVEIIPLSSPNKLTVNKDVRFKVYQNGEAVPNARVVVVYDNEHYIKNRIGDLYDVENARESNIYANKDGEFSFVPKKAGLVLLFVTIHKKTPDAQWESYNSSLTLEVNLPTE